MNETQLPKTATPKTKWKSFISGAEYLPCQSSSLYQETWFNDEVIKPKKARKAQSKLIERAEGKKDIKFNELVNHLYSEFSRYTHPTFSISKINMNHNNKFYDYKCSHIKNIYPSLPFSFEEVIVLIINMFCNLREIYKIDQKKYIELRGYVDRLQN